MSNFTKIDAIRKHLRLVPPRQREEAQSPVAVPLRAAVLETGKRVQKNLSILERDAKRLTALAKRDGISQARLLTAALDAYEEQCR